MISLSTRSAIIVWRSSRCEVGDALERLRTIDRSHSSAMFMLVDRDRQRVGVEPGAVAHAARHQPHVALDRVAGGVGLGLGVTPLEVGDHALVLRGVRAGAAVAVPELDVDPLGVADAVQQQLLVLLRQRANGGVLVDVVRLADRLEQAVEVLGMTRGPRRDRAVGDERSGSGTTSSGSTSNVVPRPSHAVQAPYGELNEKFRGASSSNDLPSLGSGQLLGEGQDLVLGRVTAVVADLRHDLDLRPRPRPGGARSPSNR